MIAFLRLFICLLLILSPLFFSTAVYASQGSPETILAVKFKTDPPVQLSLLSFHGINSKKIDSARADKTGAFMFSNSGVIKSGFYRLFVNDTNYLDIILTGQELVQLHFEKGNLRKKVSIKGSSENQALLEMKEYRLALNAAKNDLFAKMKNARTDQAERTVLIKKLDSMEKVSNDWNAALLSKHKGSYFALTGKPILPVMYSDSALLSGAYKRDTLKFLKENFFNNIDFSQADLVNSTLLPNQYMKYLERYVEYDEPGFKFAIDLILGKAKANNQVYELSLDFLMHLFGEVGPEVIFEYLVDNYYDKNTCNKSYVDKAERMQSLKSGNILPDVDISSFSNYSSLKELYSKNKFTLLFFWSSHCAFCTESIPLLLQAYPEWKKKNIEIVGFSLDENKEDWSNYISEKKISWENFNELKGWDSEVVRTLMINKTPTFILVGQDGVILEKSYNFVDMQRLFKEPDKK